MMRGDIFYFDFGRIKLIFDRLQIINYAKNQFCIALEIIMQLSQCVCLDDFQKHAQTSMETARFFYIESGAEDEITKKRNRNQFHKLMMIPRVLISSSNPDTSCTILGRKCRYPFGFAPTAMNQLANKQGEKVPARIAKEYELAYCLSLLSTTSFSDIKEFNGNGLRLLQMYVSVNWETTLRTIQFAEKYGFHGLAITVDAQVLGVRRKEKLYQFDSSSFKFPILQEISKGTENMGHQRKSYLKNRDLGLTWETIEKIRSITKLKIVLKGVLHHEDAKMATKCCDAIWVSNHGGRQLDGVISPIEVLPKIRAAVGKDFEVYVDGGVRTGNDILKCLALGADYVFVGRPISYCLTFGYDGVKKMVDILADEFRRGMILTGCNNIKEISPSLVKPQPNL